MAVSSTEFRQDVILSAQEIGKIFGSMAVPEGISGICTDTRQIRKGDLFFAIKGEKFDGADFIDEAFKRGASLCVAQVKTGNPRVIKVPDSIKALGNLAKHIRAGFTGKIVAITGSNGKTTTKNMTASILKEMGRVRKTTGNFNNQIGLPLTIAGLKNDVDFLVCEMGMNHSGELKYLAGIADPDIGVITNVGPVHLEFLGDLEGVMKAKKELFDSLGPDDVAAVNIDDKMVVRATEGFRGKKFTYSLETKRADLNVEYCGEKDGMTNLRLETGGKKIAVESPLPGVHNAYNAAAAIALSLILGAGREAIQKGLRTVSNDGMRFEIHMLKNNGILVNDCYNANPASTKAALEYVSKMKGKKYFVFGDMLELGEFSDSFHSEIGRCAARLGFSRFLLLGERRESVAKGAVEAGLAESAVTGFKSHDELFKRLKEEFEKDSVILVKGSRGMRMEEISKKILEQMKG